ncbi:NAD(P)-dependent alcohol dehydrogenase [Rugamonas rivuli]|uniref:Alcohol dehydrogenase catalytic domain-containing protein n=1 Tax=Rugamonas rivuli TaxID=2743358 RepID=A0A843S8R7_9BURK|nr:NAD(P)-dependent alcohol dehydrogenase [Rugamonas rivuli]MQA18544.1 alcohol dehydrogenase catalytic domain-containing protein [Rugamonas rivuli]
MKITAALARGAKQALAVTELELDEPRDDEVLVRVVASGICRTDIDVRDGYLPTPTPVVLGHEGSGVVVRVGRLVRQFAPGDHVVMSMGSCGVCPSCQVGMPAYCVQHVPLNFMGSRPDGSVCMHEHGEHVHSHFFSQSSHASFTVAHQSSLVKVPNDVDLRWLGPLACGVMTGAGGVINTLKPEAGTSIVIFGAGTVGLSALMASKIVACSRRIVVDNKPERLALARELGATDTILSTTDTDVAAQVRALTDGLGAHNAFESSGVKSVIGTALMAIRERGTCVITGVLPQGSVVEFDAWQLLRGRTVRGSVMGDCLPSQFVPRLVEFYRQGLLPLEKISRLYPLADINQAIENGISGAVVKAIVVMPHPDASTT